MAISVKKNAYKEKILITLSSAGIKVITCNSHFHCMNKDQPRLQKQYFMIASLIMDYMFCMKFSFPF